MKWRDRQFMKPRKLSKLAIFGACATASAIPLATLASCSRDTFYEFDLTEGYKGFEFDPISSDKWLTNDEATNAYVEAVKADPRIFVSDFARGEGEIIENLSGMYKVSECTLSATAPTFGSVKVAEPGYPDLTYPTASFKVKFHAVAETDKSSNSASKDKVKYEVDFNVEYKDVIWTAYQYNSSSFVTNDEPIKGQWVIGMLDSSDLGRRRSAPYSYKYNTNPWSIDIDYNCDVTTTIENPSTESTQEIVSNCAYNGAIDSFQKLDQTLALLGNIESGMADEQLEGYMFMRYAVAFDHHSYQLSNVTPVPQFWIPAFEGSASYDTYEGTSGTVTFPMELIFDPSQYVGADWTLEMRKPTEELKFVIGGERVSMELLPASHNDDTWETINLSNPVISGKWTGNLEGLAKGYFDAQFALVGWSFDFRLTCTDGATNKILYYQEYSLLPYDSTLSMYFGELPPQPTPP